MEPLPRALPGPLLQAWLLFGLRLRSGLNRARTRRVLSFVTYLLSASPAVFLAFLFYGLERVRVVANSPFGLFILSLSSFVTTCLFMTWPLLSAGVDDHGELSRFATYPLSSRRLVWTSVIAGIFEPRAIALSGPVAGAALGFISIYPRLQHPLPLALFALSFAGYLFLNSALSRAIAHLALNVLRDKRSAELIGGGFLVFLLLASLIPPVDTSWLTQAGGALNHLGPDTVARAAFALLYVPSGFCAGTLVTLALAKTGGAVLLVALELVCGLAALVLADWLLVRFYRRTRGAPARPPSARGDPFQTARTLEGALAWREVLDLFRNPRARLLAAVPFVLAILLKLLSARALLRYLLGPRADAALVGALALYGALVMTSTFAQNAFGYDGGPFRALLSSPVPLEAVLRAKNRVHGAAGLLLALAVIAFFRVHFAAGSAWELLCVALAALGLVPALLAAGNFLSALFPVKFHENLERRDRLPLAAVSLGMAAALAAIAPYAWLLRRELPGPLAAFGCLVFAAGLFALYRATFPLAVRLLERRREQVLAAVSRQASN